MAFLRKIYNRYHKKSVYCYVLLVVVVGGGGVCVCVRACVRVCVCVAKNSFLVIPVWHTATMSASFDFFFF